MISIRRSNSNDNDFKYLVKCLDDELRVLDGEDHAFYAQFNKTTDIDCVIAYIDNKPVACGAIRKYSDASMEVKRMFTLVEHRGKGIALEILNALEKWTRELGYKTCILETGRRQPWAISLYTKAGYHEISNYGDYVNDLNSVCFEKKLS